MLATSARWGLLGVSPLLIYRHLLHVGRLGKGFPRWHSRGTPCQRFPAIPNMCSSTRKLRWLPIIRHQSAANVLLITRSAAAFARSRGQSAAAPAGSLEAPGHDGSGTRSDRVS